MFATRDYFKLGLHGDRDKKRGYGSVMREIFNSLLELLFPSKCHLCGDRSPEPLCESCFTSLPRISGTICAQCGKPYQQAVNRCSECSGKSFSFSQVRSAGLYAGTLKEAIHHLKYKNGKKLAPQLAGIISSCASDIMGDADVVAFVPLTSYKEATRGYNQSKLIAQELARKHDKPLYANLKKIRDIPEQNKLGLSERPGNVRGAFSAVSPVHGNVILIDDVFTTGSTANECALALKNAGASKVFVLTVARTPLTDH